MSVTDRIGVGGLWITLDAAPQTSPHTSSAPHQETHSRPVVEPVPPALVWRSVRSGALLARGRAMTQQQAIHAILTHSRNEIIQAQTTAARIAYRTPPIHGGAGSVCVYEGNLPVPTHRIPSQPHSDAEGIRAATPTVVSAQPQTPPVTPRMRYRVWRQPLADVDHAYESSDEQFFVQTTTLAEAIQLERVLEAYDTWQDRQGEHDIEVWDGTTWTSDVDPVALTAAEAFLQRIYDLDDITPVAAGRKGSRHADSA